ncbi:hypothetical protein F5Y16DRAFT_42692 [Xylariaceae sp. FL0255]|nr:hypothetical protein F5Y16DRAFT_42692 [Xylariaceae sp. FL0255]
MPSATQPVLPSMVSPSTRKRMRDDDAEVQMPYPTYGNSEGFLSAINSNERLLLTANRTSTSLFNVPRKVIPLPVGKKLRIVDDNEHYHDQTSKSHNQQQSASPGFTQQSYFSHAHPDHTPSSTHQTRPPLIRSNNTSGLLSPCHICHRKPIKKSDLDSFADCMGCSQRTCFVCIRACQGWLPSLPTPAEEEDIEDLSASFTMQDVDDENNNNNDDDDHIRGTAELAREENKQKKGEGGGGGDTTWSGRGHREVICSQCCVERGSEGDVVCLGCLAGIEGV